MRLNRELVAASITSGSSTTTVSRDLPAASVCGHWIDSSGKTSTISCDSGVPCQQASTLTFEVYSNLLYCSNKYDVPVTTVYDYGYGPSHGCGSGELCCPKTLPSFIQYNYNDGLTAQWGCVTEGDITVAAHAARESFPGRDVVISSVPTSAVESTSSRPLSATATARPALSVSPSGPSATATSAKQGSSHGNGLNTASEVGSVLGAIFAALAVAVAIYFGVRELRKRRMHHIQPVKPIPESAAQFTTGRVRRAPTV